MAGKSGRKNKGADQYREQPVAAQPAEGEHIYQISLWTPSKEKIELELSAEDSIADVKEFLLGAPETCFYTCYDLVLHVKGGSTRRLEDHIEISDIADITSFDCSLCMVDGRYDESSIRSHLRHVRDLLSPSNLHVSQSTVLLQAQQSAQQKSAGSDKTIIQELDSLNFMEDSAGALTNLLASVPAEIKCVESIVFSPFNPPPRYRRLHGDLIYIDVVTLEGKKHCITGSSTSFYVNCSDESSLDLKPTKKGPEASTLVVLLQKISDKFRTGFRELVNHRALAHPLDNIGCLLPVTCWLGANPVPEHRRDAARAEESFLLSYGMQRDWNEELQSCREFPHGNAQERKLRGRALYKVTSDFVDAAVKGAVGVINRCIQPINPTDPECFHVYVHNNIFFRFAVDSEYHSTSDDLFDASAEAESADRWQVTYASINNELKGTKAYQEADIPGLYNPAMAIIDYRGYRVVAWSIIPFRQGDISNFLLYGSVDNGKKISWNDSFHSKVVEAAKRLHLKEHAVLNGSGNPLKLAATVKCKGFVGSDDRQWQMKMHCGVRMAPMDYDLLLRSLTLGT